MQGKDVPAMREQVLCYIFNEAPCCRPPSRGLVTNSAGSDGPQATGGRNNGKGLRHFSMKVCEKVESKGRTTYNEVADELVGEFSGAAHIPHIIVLLASAASSLLRTPSGVLPRDASS